MPMIVSKADAPDQRIVLGEVYSPDRPDAQGEFMRADEIRKMAHEFVMSKKIDQVDVMHDNQLVPCHVVESFIARDGDPDFIPGSWVIAMQFPEGDLWDRVKKGGINGFSMEALVSRHEQELEVDIPPVVTGKTSKSDDHEHEFFVSYDAHGQFKGGTTDSVKGHQHAIKAGTHTEVASGHSHRFSSVDSLKIE